MKYCCQKAFGQQRNHKKNPMLSREMETAWFNFPLWKEMLAADPQQVQESKSHWITESPKKNKKKTKVQDFSNYFQSLIKIK